MVTDAVANELAPVRQFHSVRGALLWFQGYDARLGSTSQAIGLVSPKSREEREREHATWAQLRLCLRERDPGVDVFELRYASWLLDWHRAEESQRVLVRRLGFPSLYALRKAMQFTETVLSERMARRRLLVGRA